jgi:hypothetical protein
MATISSEIFLESWAFPITNHTLFFFSYFNREKSPHQYQKGTFGFIFYFEEKKGK